MLAVTHYTPKARKAESQARFDADPLDKKLGRGRYRQQSAQGGRGGW